VGAAGAPVLVLASTSPRRSQLLGAAGIAFVPGQPGPEPDAPGEPAQVARERARRKAVGAVPPPGVDLPVLGVDTVVDLDGSELGKPRDRAHAARMLTALAGRIHRVHTAHCLFEPRSGRAVEELATATVECRTPSAAELEAYLDGGEWWGKAGAYGLQDRTQSFLTLRDGAFDTVVGLHVAAVLRLLALLRRAP
jgi:septum formation protein